MIGILISWVITKNKNCDCDVYIFLKHYKIFDNIIPV